MGKKSTFHHLLETCIKASYLLKDVGCLWGVDVGREQPRIQYALDGCTADVEPTDQTVPCHRCTRWSVNMTGLVRGDGGCRISGEEKVRFFHRDPENPRKMIVIFNHWLWGGGFGSKCISLLNWIAKICEKIMELLFFWTITPFLAPLKKFAPSSHHSFSKIPQQPSPGDFLAAVTQLHPLTLEVTKIPLF